MDLVKRELQIRVTFSETCVEFFNFLKEKDSRELLKAAKKNTKYTWKNLN